MVNTTTNTVVFNRNAAQQGGGHNKIRCGGGAKTLGRFKSILTLPDPDIRKQHLLHMDARQQGDKTASRRGTLSGLPDSSGSPGIRSLVPPSGGDLGEDTEPTEDFLFPRGLKDNKRLREEHLGDLSGNGRTE